ncbi:peroxiredoxin-like family protein [cf. Phormidesmis sp. LEGE 11477]|uniref:peroxiredoxin-like family protein n=1 Tax=cf. Phormidesmis sp. LEGE 11477 TaxID=1828680 RepID=UPI001881D1EC|nr:peroxiredoxin-like family protein [cf. Phormidesmis sp. LEGE 11477]MBE9064554.1 AhpC/TSA family protein [cf. Phormidesmis sp. LEGE 11477]
MDARSALNQTSLLRVSDAQQATVFESCRSAKRTLVLVWPQLGDFDTLEYAWWIERNHLDLEAANIQVRAVAIGDRTAGKKFCDYTHFPPEHLHIDPAAELHQKLGLYKGLSVSLPGLSAQQNGYFNLLLMCAGIGSPGTLKEVLRGYTGDKSAPQLIADDEMVKARPLPALKGEVFKSAGGKGFQRPFELATLRLRNMGEVLSNWKTYVPDAAYLTWRGATFLFDADADGELLYEWRDPGILGFAENMSNPLAFLDKVN